MKKKGGKKRINISQTNKRNKIRLNKGQDASQADKSKKLPPLDEPVCTPHSTKQLLSEKNHCSRNYILQERVTESFGSI